MHGAERKHAPADVSIIVPMCNEEESLKILQRKLQNLHVRLQPRFAVEYCLVDDGSTDRTGELMGSVVPCGARSIQLRHASNNGLGAALRTGMRAVTGAIVCTIDADCSYPPEDLLTLIEVVVSGQADIAIASPYHPEGDVVGVKRWRLLLSRQCSLLYRLISPLKLYTYTSIFRAYRGTAARQIEFESDGFVSCVEMLFSAVRLGYTVQEIPMVLRARERGYSKIRIAKTIWAHLRAMKNITRQKRGYAAGRRTHAGATALDAVPAPAAMRLAAELRSDDTPMRRGGTF